VSFQIHIIIQTKCAPHFTSLNVPSSWVQLVSFRRYKINRRVFLNPYLYSDTACSSFYVIIQTLVSSSWVQLVSFRIYKINWRVFLDPMLNSSRYSDKVSSSFISLFRRTRFVHLFLDSVPTYHLNPDTCAAYCIWRVI